MLADSDEDQDLDLVLDEVDEQEEVPKIKKRKKKVVKEKDVVQADEVVDQQAGDENENKNEEKPRKSRLKKVRKTEKEKEEDMVKKILDDDDIPDDAEDIHKERDPDFQENKEVVEPGDDDKNLAEEIEKEVEMNRRAREYIEKLERKRPKRGNISTTALVVRSPINSN